MKELQDNLDVVLANKMILLGNRVKNIRLYRKLTQQYVAFSIGTDKCVISSIELGTRRNVTLFTIVKIASALDVELTDLLHGI